MLGKQTAVINHKKPIIYMDHAATTPVRPEVVQTMEPYFTSIYGNPSSVHSAGRKANVMLRQARHTIANCIGASENEIIFTSGGSESDNGALRGIALARRTQTGANQLIISAIEHHAVLHTAQDLAQNFGFDLTILAVDSHGLIALSDLEQALEQKDVALVSIMLANNEVGTIQPLEKIGQLCRTHGALLHSDVVQAAGRLALDVTDLGVDALSTSAHKFYGPKGVGFLYLRSGTPFQPVQTGGSHESARRAGTENVPLIVGMATALELAEAERASESERLSELRDTLIDGVLTNVKGAYLTGTSINPPPPRRLSSSGSLERIEIKGEVEQQQRISHIASFIIRGVEAEGILIGLDMASIAASSGSACTSGAQRPSHVLEAMGIDPTDAAGGLRLSLGRSTTENDIAYIIERLPAIVERVRGR